MTWSRNGPRQIRNRSPLPFAPPPICLPSSDVIEAVKAISSPSSLMSSRVPRTSRAPWRVLQVLEQRDGFAGEKPVGAACVGLACPIGESLGPRLGPCHRLARQIRDRVDEDVALGLDHPREVGIFRDDMLVVRGGEEALGVSALIDKEVTAFPAVPSALSPMLRLYDRGKAFKSRFIHAKLIIAQGANADHVLFGSANCTVAALGAGTIPGINAEASLYRRLPPGTALIELDLAEVFSSEPLSITDIPSREVPEDEIEFERLAAANPGQFRILGDQLSWCPSPNYANVACDLALQDQRGEEVVVELVPLQSDGSVRRYRLGAPVRDVRQSSPSQSDRTSNGPRRPSLPICRTSKSLRVSEGFANWSRR